MKKKKAALVTGFEPYGGMNLNPSAEIVRRLDGAKIGGVPVVGRLLPVDIARLDAALKAALAGLDPVAVILLGLAPGETCIRLERVALNLADFPIPDNAGAKTRDQPLDRWGNAALWSRLPLRAIETRLLGMGIPARLSESARMAMISDAAVITNPVSRAGPLSRPPRPVAMRRSARSFMSMQRGQMISFESSRRSLPKCR